MKRRSNRTSRFPRPLASGSEKGIDPLEKLFSARIGELMDFRVFRKCWKSIFGNERGMLVKEPRLIKPHQRR